MAKKTCFVVMGFGEKPDFATGRTLDLDKSYRVIIKRAVEDAGLECIRADDVVHAGMIDDPMYRLLFSADVVVADLSTSNANALYELGVRHALRPHTTIVLAESQFKFPFDLSHVVIQPYEHLGKVIDAEVADTTREALRKKIVKLVETPEVDSPVYRFLTGLEEWKPAVGGGAKSPPPAEVAGAGDAGRVSTLLELFREARAAEDWAEAATMLKKLLVRNPSDPYLNQQLALVTYKGKKPDAKTALLAAKEILQKLDPDNTTDAETLGLWGAVHKRLWEIDKTDLASLNAAIWALEKGFYVKNDHYNGINLAFLLNARATVSSPRDAIADATIAERVRRRVIDICQAQIAKPLTDEKGKIDAEQMYWVKASLVEAWFGTGQTKEADALQKELVPTPGVSRDPAEWTPENWMPKTLQDQLDKLKGMLSAVPGIERIG